MRNLILIAALAAETALAGFAPAMAEEKTQASNQQASAVDPIQTSSIGSSVTGEWLKLCINPTNAVMCQGHATYLGKITGSESPAPAAPTAR